MTKVRLCENRAGPRADVSFREERKYETSASTAQTIPGKGILICLFFRVFIEKPSQTFRSGCKSYSPISKALQKICAKKQWKGSEYL